MSMIWDNGGRLERERERNKINPGPITCNKTTSHLAQNTTDMSYSNVISIIV